MVRASDPKMITIWLIILVIILILSIIISADIQAAEYIFIKADEVTNLPDDKQQQIIELLSEMKGSRATLREIKDSNSKLLILHADDSVVAMLKICTVRDSPRYAHIKKYVPEHYRYLCNLITFKKHRNKGYGTKLMKAVASIPNLSLEVNKNNIVAIKLYDKFGFQIIAENNDNYIMVRI